MYQQRVGEKKYECYHRISTSSPPPTFHPPHQLHPPPPPHPSPPPPAPPFLFSLLPQQVYPIKPPTNDNNKSRNSHYSGMCKISEDNGRITIQIEHSFVISEPPASRVMDLIGGLCSSGSTYERCFHNCKTPPSDHIPSSSSRHPRAPN